LINQEETTVPNGRKGPGPFRYLRTLTSSNGDNRRDVIATVFRGVQNRMVSEATHSPAAYPLRGTFIKWFTGIASKYP
jgi:hypothetical protein